MPDNEYKVASLLKSVECKKIIPHYLLALTRDRDNPYIDLNHTK